MNSKEAIIQKIVSDAQQKADETAAEAKAKADAILSVAEEQAAEIIARSEDAKKAQTESILANSAVVAGLDCKKALLTAKADLVRDVFSQAADELKKDKKRYVALVKKMIETSAEDGDVVQICKDDKEVITKQVVDSVAKKLKIKLSLDKKFANIRGGVLLLGKNYDKNLSLDLETQELRESCESEIAAILFEGNDNGR